MEILKILHHAKLTSVSSKLVTRLVDPKASFLSSSPVADRLVLQRLANVFDVLCVVWLWEACGSCLTVKVKKKKKNTEKNGN